MNLATHGKAQESEPSGQTYTEEEMNERIQESKEKALGVISFMIKSIQITAEKLQESVPLIELDEAEFLIQYISEHLQCTDQELTKAFRHFTGYDI